MKQPTNTFFDATSLPRLARQLNDVVRRTNEQVNALTEGRLAAEHTALPEPPTNGPYAVGDIVPNLARGAVLGDEGSQYLLLGWMCTAATEPPEWAEMRVSTGT